MDHSVINPWQFVRSEWDVLFQALIQDGFESESKSPIAAIFRQCCKKIWESRWNLEHNFTTVNSAPVRTILKVKLDQIFRKDWKELVDRNGNLVENNFRRRLLEAL